MSHDQNFKNLILDYAAQALAFFAAAEAGGLTREPVRITPIRQEQLQERLGERFRELDIPLLVEWPDGRRAALLFVIEEESDPRRFSIHRLAHYCLDLSELLDTERVVPAVIFLRGGDYRRELTLGGDRFTYLHFHYLACNLSELPWERYRDSDNLVARLNLPNMRYSPAEKVEVYAAAVRGLLTLEPDPERQLKYVDFIDIYTGLDDNERQQYRERYPNEVETMSSFAERFRQEGMQQGMQQGIQRGMQQAEKTVLLRQLRQKFGEVPLEARRRIEAADAETLLEWLDRVLSASRIEDVLR